MICIAREYVRTLVRRPRFRYQRPARTVIFMGARRERIDANFDRMGRLTCLIVHTRQRE